MPPTSSDENGRKLFIGGLSWDTTEESLRAYFEKFGTVQELILMKDVTTGKSRGFAFVTLQDVEVMDDIFAASPHTIDGKVTDVKLSGPRATAKDKMAHSSLMADKKIYVGGLDLDETESSMRKFFNRYGTVTTVQLVFNRETKQCRGFGFVAFESHSSAAALCRLGSVTKEGKALDIKPATKQAGERGEIGQMPFGVPPPRGYGGGYHPRGIRPEPTSLPYGVGPRGRGYPRPQMQPRGPSFGQPNPMDNRTIRPRMPVDLSVADRRRPGPTYDQSDGMRAMYGRPQPTNVPHRTMSTDYGDRRMTDYRDAANSSRDAQYATTATMGNTTYDQRDGRDRRIPVRNDVKDNRNSRGEQFIDPYGDTRVRQSYQTDTPQAGDYSDIYGLPQSAAADYSTGYGTASNAYDTQSQAYMQQTSQYGTSQQDYGYPQQSYSAYPNQQMNPYP